MKVNKKLLISAATILFFTVHFFWAVSLLSSCTYMHLCTDDDIKADLSYTSDGTCSYTVVRKAECEDSKIENLIDIGKDACINSNMSCANNTWSANLGHWNTVKGTCTK
jgi:hypothetical protein